MLQKSKIIFIAVAVILMSSAAAQAVGSPSSPLNRERVYSRSPALRSTGRLKKLQAGKSARVVKASPRVAEPEVEKVALDIPDLKTVDNVNAVTTALRKLPGVHTAVVDLKIHLAVVDYNPARTGVAEFLTACRGAGFDAEEYRVEQRFPKPIKLKGG